MYWATPNLTVRQRCITSRMGTCLSGTVMTESDLAVTAARGNLGRRRMKPDPVHHRNADAARLSSARRGWGRACRQRRAPGITYPSHGRVSDFGSGAGAEGLRQAPSRAVCVTDRRWLTWENVPDQHVGQPPDSVRIEGVRGSNPLSSTQRYSHFTSVHVHIWL